MNRNNDCLACAVKRELTRFLPQQPQLNTCQRPTMAKAGLYADGLHMELKIMSSVCRFRCILCTSTWLLASRSSSYRTTKMQRGISVQTPYHKLIASPPRGQPSPPCGSPSPSSCWHRHRAPPTTSSIPSRTKPLPQQSPSEAP